MFEIKLSEATMTRKKSFPAEKFDSNNLLSMVDKSQYIVHNLLP